MKKIKSIFLTLMIICLVSTPLNIFAENENPEEQKTEEKQEEKEEEVKPEEENPKVNEDNESPDLSNKTNENKDQSNRDKEIIKKPMETPSSATGEVYNGDGTVVDFTTTGSKAFYTVKSADNSSIYYIVIDMDKTENNVYFLSEINGEELSLSEVTSQNNQANTEIEEAKPELPEEKTKSKSNQNSTFWIILIGAAGLFGYQLFFGKLKNLNPLNKKDEEEKSDISKTKPEENVYMDQEAKDLPEDEEIYVDEDDN